MKQQTFWIWLAGISAISAVALFFLLQSAKFTAHAPFTWSTLAFFVLFTVLAFFYGSMAARSSNKHQFTNAFMGLTMGKMMISGMIVATYWFVVKPGDKLFIVPFFAIYLVYTVFEAAVLMQVGSEAKS